MTRKTCIIIAGPTAVGKTALALQLASLYNTSIISADSRQCYRELNIAVAKPTPAELAAVPHYFINSHSIHQDCNAAGFSLYARDAVGQIFQDRPVAILVGGTGLYIRAFRDGLDEIPSISAATRTRVVAGYANGGLPWLQREVERLDPAYYASGEIQNPQRLMRALEVAWETGSSIRSFQSGASLPRDFDCITLGLELERQQLYQNINQRVDRMMQQGLLEEARALFPFRDLNALQTVGYRELFEYFAGNTDLETAIDRIKKNTRHYAKRQLTWFHRDTSVKWFPALDPDQVFNYLQKMV